MPDTNKSDRTNIREKIAAEVTGFLDGIGEAIYEIVRGRTVSQLLVLWAITLVATDRTISRFAQIFEHDPDGTLAQLRADQRERFYHLIMHDAERALGALLAKLHEVGSGAFKKGTEVYNYLRQIEIANAQEIIEANNRRRTGYQARIERAQNSRKKQAKYGGIFTIILLFLAASVRPEEVPWLWVGVSLIILAVLALVGWKFWPTISGWFRRDPAQAEGSTS